MNERRIIAFISLLLHEEIVSYFIRWRDRDGGRQGSIGERGVKRRKDTEWGEMKRGSRRPKNSPCL